MSFDSGVIVSAVKSCDDRWEKMVKAFKSCEEADTDFPKVLVKYFKDYGINIEGGDKPDPTGTEMRLLRHNAMTGEMRIVANGAQGYIELRPKKDGEVSALIEVSKLPQGTQFIKITGSWDS
jgi:hypothetical protein